MKVYWSIGDIHGRYDLLIKLYEEMQKNGFDFADPNNVIIQLGDRNDRGPDTYLINEWFMTHQIMWPGQVICLMGNHDRMLIDAALNRSDLMYFNGGNATLKSYAKVSSIYGKNDFGSSVQKAGHFHWLKNLPLFYETPEFFFSHAPIPNRKYATIDDGTDFRTDEHSLTWSYANAPEHLWIEHNLIPIEENGNFQGKHKVCFSGHIHGMRMGETGRGRGTIVPGVRKYGHAIILDTGSGCADAGYLSCVRSSDLQVITSRGESYPLQDTDTSKPLPHREISDEKVDF